MYFWLFGGLLLLLVTTVVVSALRAREAEPDETGGDPGRRLEAAVAALREVEFDYRTGKLPEEEYRALRTAHGREALAARRELESLSGAPATRAAAGGAGSGAGEGAGAGERVPVPDATGSAASREAGRCGTCGASVESGDRFCRECGAPVRGSGPSRPGGDDPAPA